MSTLRFSFRVGGVLTAATSVLLSDPTGTYGVKRNDTDATVVADGTAMSAVSTGVYEYTVTDPANDLEYTWYAEALYDGATYRFMFTADGPTSSTTATALWTVNTLCAHIRGELDTDPNASGGTVPDRLKSIVKESGISLWNANDWMFRLRLGTLTTVASTATVAVPDDFAELHSKWVRQSTDSKSWHGVRFTANKLLYQEWADSYVNSDPSEPVYAVVDTDHAQSAFAQQFRLTPTPDDVYTYPYWYVTKDPWSLSTALDDDTAPKWPSSFMEGWHLRALARSQRAFGKPVEVWRETWQAYKDWEQVALAELNETMTQKGLEPTHGNYEDFMAGGYDHNPFSQTVTG